MQAMDASVSWTITGIPVSFCKTQEEPKLTKVESFADLTLDDYTTPGKSGSQGQDTSLALAGSA